jgi:uncharacterized protein
MFSWLRKPARPPGQAALPGNVSELGVPRGCDDAVKWYRKAAEKGTCWGLLNLGIRYFRGEGVAQNYDEAIKWFHQAANQGDAMSQYYLGEMYEKGLGTAVDLQEACKWYCLAAGHGVREAETALCHLRHGQT